MSSTNRNAEETYFENLARFTRAWTDGRETAAGQETGWLAIERSMRRRTQSLARRRVLGASALAVTAVAALMVLRGFGSSNQNLTFVVSDGMASVGGGVQPGQIPARLSFSDGSDVVLNPGARGTVVGTTVHGARIRLDRGRARFSVSHRPHTDWSVDAGPFTVVVHGTVFDVSWSNESGALAVDLIAGAITIKGPVVGGAVLLRAGQRLTARASTGQTHIDPMGVAVAADHGGVAFPDVAPAVPAGLAADQVTERRDPLGAEGTANNPRRWVRSAASGSGTRSIAEVSAHWASRVASGAFQSVVEEADTTGVERCLAQAPAASLGALADAARYARRTDLARRALLAERRRFAGSVGAHDAAFLIGRLAEDADKNPREALVWYDHYLEEGEHGTYVSEALGRKMVALDRLGEAADARVTAGRYLAAFPDGAFATRARRIQVQR